MNIKDKHRTSKIRAEPERTINIQEILLPSFKISAMIGKGKAIILATYTALLKKLLIVNNLRGHLWHL